MLKNKNHKSKTRNASFSLEERLGLLKILKPKIKLVGSQMNDNIINESKKEAWVQIQKEFVELYPERHLASAKDIRELWRRMKHRARMEVRQKVQAAKQGGIRTLNEEQMGWMATENHTVVDINDLGLEVDTMAITEFVPLLEEEATVLETRNGVLQGVAENGQSTLIDLDDTAAASSSTSHETRPDAFDYAEQRTEEGDADDVQCISPIHHIKVEPMSLASEPDQQQHTAASPFSNRDTDRVFHVSSLNQPPSTSIPTSTGSPPVTRSDVTPLLQDGRVSPPTTMTTLATSSKEQELLELKVKQLTEQHRATMALKKLEQDAARAALEAARAKRSAYDEKRMFYFEKRKQLHTEVNHL